MNHNHNVEPIFRHRDGKLQYIVCKSCEEVLSRYSSLSDSEWERNLIEFANTHPIKNNLAIGKVKHSNLGTCKYTLNCYMLDCKNINDTTYHVVYDGDIREVSFSLIKNVGK